MHLVVRADKYRALYEAAVEHATRVEGVPVFVVNGEYLIAMKMVAGRPKDDADLEFLIADGGVDLERARAVVSEHLGPYAVDELERYYDEVALAAVARFPMTSESRAAVPLARCLP